MTLSLTKPSVGGSTGTWGTVLNTALDAIVTEVNNGLQKATVGTPVSTQVLTTTFTGDTLPRLAITIDGGISTADPQVTLTNVTGTTTLTYTTSTSHNYNAGDIVLVSGVVGITGVNGSKTVATRPTATSFTVTGASGSGAYTSGGTVQRTWGGNGLASEGHWNFILNSNKPGLTIRGQTGVNQNLLLASDFLNNPIFAVASSGGASVLGDNFRVFGGGDIFNPVIKLRFDGSVQMAKGDPSGGVGVLAMGNVTTQPTGQSDGTHTLDGSTTTAGVVQYALGGRAYLMTQGGQAEELNQPTLRRSMTVVKDGGAATVSSVGSPAAALTGTATSGDSLFLGPLVNLATTTTLNSIAGVGPAAYTQVMLAWTPMFWCRLVTDPAAITSVRYWAGLFSADPALISSPTGIHVAAFRYDTGADGTAFWRTVTSAASASPTVTTTTTAIAANTRYDLRVEVNNANTAVRFLINEVVVATHTTTLPTASQPLGPAVKLTTLTTAIRNVLFCKWVLGHFG